MRSQLAALLEELGDQPRPPRLVARTDARAVVAVEVLVERDQVAPVRVALEEFRSTVDGTTAVGAGQEQSAQASRQLGGDLPEVELPAGARGAGDGEALAEVVVKLLERLDQQEIDGKPHRAAPVRIAAKEVRGG